MSDERQRAVVSADFTDEEITYALVHRLEEISVEVNDLMKQFPNNVKGTLGCSNVAGYGDMAKGLRLFPKFYIETELKVDLGE